MLSDVRERQDLTARYQILLILLMKGTLLGGGPALPYSPTSPSNIFPFKLTQWPAHSGPPGSEGTHSGQRPEERGRVRFPYSFCCLKEKVAIQLTPVP